MYSPDGRTIAGLNYHMSRLCGILRLGIAKLHLMIRSRLLYWILRIRLIAAHSLSSMDTWENRERYGQGEFI